MNLFLQTIKEYLKENHTKWVVSVFFDGVILIERTINDEYHISIDTHRNELSLYRTWAGNTTINIYDGAKYAETTVQYTETTLLQQIDEIISVL